MNLSRLLIPILIFPFLMCAAEVAPQPVGVAELVRQAVATNPERQAYDAALAAERETASAAGSNQNPVLSLEVGRKRFRDAGGVFADEGQVWTATLSQTFEWPERVRLRRAIADRQVEAAKLGLGRFEQAIEGEKCIGKHDAAYYRAGNVAFIPLVTSEACCHRKVAFEDYVKTVHAFAGA